MICGINLCNWQSVIQIKGIITIKFFTHISSQLPSMYQIQGKKLM